jgi:hypothetical protein
MYSLSSKLRVALEDVADGKAHIETEHVLYARITDFAFLANAKSMEHHEQWELKFPKTDKNAGSGRIRIRKTVREGMPPEYTQTSKTKDPKSGGNVEVTIPVSEELFNQFRIMSGNGMRKDRYHYPVDDGSDRVYEVDMYLKHDSQPGAKQYYEWCKIDLEVDDMNAAMPPLPEGFADIISAPFGKRTDEEEARVTSLYHNEFTAKNPFL